MLDGHDASRLHKRECYITGSAYKDGLTLFSIEKIDPGNSILPTCTTFIFSAVLGSSKFSSGSDTFHSLSYLYQSCIPMGVVLKDTVVINPLLTIMTKSITFLGGD